MGRAGKHLPCKAISRGIYCCDTAAAPTPSAPISAPDGAAPLGELQPPEGAFATTAGGNSGNDGSGSGSGGWFGGWFGGSKPEQVLLVFLPLNTTSWPPLQLPTKASRCGTVVQGAMLRRCPKSLLCITRCE